ncbi:WD40 repeat-like protein [Exidia glandulosa HHB12029]|uniref:WD40 repeat-like protein n=1 Tax=Exidia glandulosa HHB12029 TaxID=1314781 RepID=A0A166A428_EXIGL|nr:WD40 repeat-like protein [Exidia glandulosa HHB12029]
MTEEEQVAGKGWAMLRREDLDRENKFVTLGEAIERFSRKRTLSGASGSSSSMAGVELQHPAHVDLSAAHSAPPRKKARAAALDFRNITPSTAGPPSPLPSPNGSPAQSAWPSAPPSGSSSPQPQAPFQPDLSLTTLMALPNLVSHFASLPPQLQSHVLLTLMRHSPLPVLRSLHSVLTPTLARDFLTQLPPELTSLVLSYLPSSALARASRVSRAWRAIIDSDAVLWCELLKHNHLWFGGGSEHAFADKVFTRRARMPPPPDALPLPHPYKLLFKTRHLTRTRWLENDPPPSLNFPAHGSAVVTCLLFSHNRIISASDDHSIHVYSPFTGHLLRSLDGHNGGVWALAATKNTLVSGSTDRTVRIWDLETGRCTHVFGGHTSTVRCLAIVKPVWVDVEVDEFTTRRERWPKRTLIVTGSRDHTLRVWKLPKEGDEEYKCFGADNGDDGDPSEEDVDDNPYHERLLEGHDHAVRALAARGRTLVSGSYDCTVRVWDIITGDCKWVLVGHTQKVYSVVMDHARGQVCSGSMDGTVRVWSLATGQCEHTLTGHTSLVGLLGLSSSHLVSAAADSTLRIWDAGCGQLMHTLAAHTGAITCFQHDEFKVLSGSDGTLKMWDVRKGTPVCDLLTGITGVWQVVFQGRWCVAASNKMDATYLDVWDFGRKGDTDEDWGMTGEGNMSDDSEDEEDEMAVEESMDQDDLPQSSSGQTPGVRGAAAWARAANPDTFAFGRGVPADTPTRSRTSRRR